MHNGDFSITDISEIESVMAKEGLVTIKIGEVPIVFDLSFLHERKYVARYITTIRYPQHDIDDELFKAFIREGDVVLDAGANIGVTAALALKAGASRIYCVEAEKHLAQRLNSIPDPRICVFHCALGEEPGFAELMLSSHNQGHSIAAQMQNVFPGLFTPDRQTVAVKTIADVTNGETCSVWKLDVEGVEPDVIRGALDLLEKAGPRVIMAELFEPFAKATFDLLAPFYNVKRAALTKAGSSLSLLEPSIGPLGDDYWHTSPTYVFERRIA